jgi:hypothetical protein
MGIGWRERRRQVNAVLAAGCALVLAACASPVNVSSSVAAALEKIPPANIDLYGPAYERQQWRNPYLQVQKEGVIVMLESGWTLSKPLTTDEMATVLSRMPSGAWPYGRVVWVGEYDTKVPADDKVAHANYVKVLAALKQLKIMAVEWPPLSG